MGNLLYAFIIGLVQGVSEWLPISSKTQILFASKILLGFTPAAAYAFGLFMEVGSLFSALFYFRKEIIEILHERQMIINLLVVTLITGIEGVPLYIITDKLLTGAYNLGLPMILLGAFLITDGLYRRYSRKITRTGTIGELKMKQYVLMGAAQGLSSLPGVSRSGMTVSTLLFMGLNPKDAFKLSYLAYIPASIGGFVTTIVFTRSELSTSLPTLGTTGLAVAILTAAVVGVFAITGLLNFAKRNDIYKVTVVFGAVALVIGLLAAVGSI